MEDFRGKIIRQCRSFLDPMSYITVNINDVWLQDKRYWEVFMSLFKG